MPQPHDQKRNSYAGGKGGAGVTHTLINLIPPHRVYIEAFLGGGAVMKAKRPAAVNIGIDRDAAALEIFPNRPDVDLIHGDALELLPALNLTPDCFVFIDAPYLFSTRRSRSAALYRCELGEDDEHARLLEVARSLRARVLITHYDCEFYREHLPTWNVENFYSYDRGNNRNLEGAFYNYPRPVALHDYGFLGNNFRQREKIRRQQRRWAARLDRMTPLERQAMLSVIEERFFCSIDGNGEDFRKPSTFPAIAADLDISGDEISSNSAGVIVTTGDDLEAAGEIRPRRKTRCAIAHR